MRPEKINVLILRGSAASDTPIGVVQAADLVLVAKTDAAQSFEVFKNRWGDRTHVVTEQTVEKFLEACGVRSAT